MSNEIGDGSGDGIVRRARRLARRRVDNSDGAALNGSDPASASGSSGVGGSSGVAGSSGVGGPSGMAGSPSSSGPSANPADSSEETATGDSSGSGGGSLASERRSRSWTEQPWDDEVDGNAAAYTGATYGMLLFLGFVVGIYGAFFFSLSVWVIPVGAIVGVLANYVMCRVAGRVMRSRLGALLPAAGWLIAVILLSSHRSEGDLIITGTVSGYLLLFGGTFSAAAAVTMNQRERNRVARRTEPPR